MKSYQDSLSGPPEKKKKPNWHMIWYTVLNAAVFSAGITGVLWYVWTDQNDPIFFVMLGILIGIPVIRSIEK